MSTPTTTPGIPIPVPDERSAGYWAAAADGVLALSCCDHCGYLAMPPDIICVGCRSTEPSFHDQPVSGNGTVRSWTVMRVAFLPGFAPLVPYTLADVELDEQANLRIVARVLAGEEVLAVGARAHTEFEEIAPGFNVPGFVIEETS
ncbi:MAG: OB-fold domain-containing protein [Ilumatobacteraceae bacterium]